MKPSIPVWAVVVVVVLGIGAYRAFDRATQSSAASSAASVSTPASTPPKADSSQLSDRDVDTFLADNPSLRSGLTKEQANNLHGQLWTVRMMGRACLQIRPGFGKDFAEISRRYALMRVAVLRLSGMPEADLAVRREGMTPAETEDFFVRRAVEMRSQVSESCDSLVALSSTYAIFR